jgi:hypothetical protein
MRDRMIKGPNDGGKKLSGLAAEREKLQKSLAKYMDKLQALCRKNIRYRKGVPPATITLIIRPHLIRCGRALLMYLEVGRTWCVR